MTMAELNLMDEQVIGIVNAANDRRAEETAKQARLRKADEDRIDKAKRRRNAELLRKAKEGLKLVASLVLLFLIMVAALVAMDMGWIPPLIGALGIVVPALLAAYVLAKDSGR